MKFSKQYLTELSRKTGFIKDTLEKVLRLAEILKFLNSDTVFRNKLALKGGTAINLTEVDLPRLSVDIDLDYTVNVSKDELPEIKRIFAERLTDYMWQEGYSLADTREFFAFTSFLFNYINTAGNRDNIKVEINYLDRCHILPLEYKRAISKDIAGNMEILTLNAIELYATKINALLSRATPRDLYDVYAMTENNVISDFDLLKKCLVFYSLVGGDYDIEKYDYKTIERLDYKKYKTQLKPVIALNDKFDIDKAKISVMTFLQTLLVFNDDEKEFISAFHNKTYRPELLFDNELILSRIANHPAAMWRSR